MTRDAFYSALAGRFRDVGADLLLLVVSVPDASPTVLDETRAGSGPLVSWATALTTTCASDLAEPIACSLVVGTVLDQQSSAPVGVLQASAFSAGIGARTLAGWPCGVANTLGTTIRPADRYALAKLGIQTAFIKQGALYLEHDWLLASQRAYVLRVKQYLVEAITSEIQQYIGSTTDRSAEAAAAVERILQAHPAVQNADFSVEINLFAGTLSVQATAQLYGEITFEVLVSI